MTQKRENWQGQGNASRSSIKGIMKHYGSGTKICLKETLLMVLLVSELLQYTTKNQLTASESRKMIWNNGVGCWRESFQSSSANKCQ